jgi:hypothetical protein
MASYASDANRHGDADMRAKNARSRDSITTQS